MTWTQLLKDLDGQTRWGIFFEIAIDKRYFLQYNKITKESQKRRREKYEY